jgi:hypothetical protein
LKTNKTLIKKNQEKKNRNKNNKDQIRKNNIWQIKIEVMKGNKRLFNNAVEITFF